MLSGLFAVVEFMEKKHYRHPPPHGGMRPFPPQYPVGDFGGSPFVGPMVPGPFPHPMVGPHFMSPLVPPMPPPGLYHPVHEPWVCVFVCDV